MTPICIVQPEHLSSWLGVSAQQDGGLHLKVHCAHVAGGIPAAHIPEARGSRGPVPRLCGNGCAGVGRHLLCGHRDQDAHAGGD